VPRMRASNRRVADATTCSATIPGTSGSAHLTDTSKKKRMEPEDPYNSLGSAAARERRQAISRRGSN
jgi:hypothetical protein